MSTAPSSPPPVLESLASIRPSLEVLKKMKTKQLAIHCHKGVVGLRFSRYPWGKYPRTVKRLLTWVLRMKIQLMKQFLTLHSHWLFLRESPQIMLPSIETDANGPDFRRQLEQREQNSTI